MYIEEIASVYEDEKLNFSINEDDQAIHFKMNTNVSQDVPFSARIVNSRTVLFKTRFPMNVPDAQREAVSSYLTRANYGLLVGSFQLDLSDGELTYVAAGCHSEEDSLSDDVICRLTYLGFQMFDDYIPGVFAIIYGGKRPADAYKEVEAAIQERRAKREQGE